MVSLIFPCLFGLKLPYIEHFPFLPPFLCQLAQENSLALDHEYYAPTRKYTRARILIDPEAVDLIVDEVFGFSVGLGLVQRTFQLDYG